MKSDRNRIVEEQKCTKATQQKQPSKFLESTALGKRMKKTQQYTQRTITTTTNIAKVTLLNNIHAIHVNIKSIDVL